MEPRKKTPILGPSSATQLPENTNCLSCSEDGRFLALGHSGGLSVWCVSSLVCVAEWLQDKQEMTSLQMTRMAETAYLLASIDDMGVARVFAFDSEVIHLLNVINIMEDINRRSVCLTFELSERGDYGAASICCNGSVWLEVYHFPIDAWLKELEEMAASQKTDLNLSGEVRWSPALAAIKIRPHKTQAASDSSLEVSQMTDVLTHCLALDAQQQEGEEETNDSIRLCFRRCTQHFLLPCGQFPEEESSRLPVSVCMWWSSSQNLFQYFLHKDPKNKPEVEPMPDVLWPNAKEIMCSAVSSCTRFIALGLSDALVCVWDRCLASPLSVVSVSAVVSSFSRLQFVKNHWPLSANDSQTFTTGQIHLMVVCKNGEIHRVTTGRGSDSCTTQLTERPKDSGDLPTVTASVPFLQGLSLVVQRNGKMFLQDVINKTTVSFLIPPKTHLLATPCCPVYALNTKQQRLFIRGDQDPSCTASSEENRYSQLFSFHLGKSDITEQFTPSLSDSSQLNAMNLDTLGEACNLYLQQRAQSLDERNKAIAQTWKKLQETAVMVQQ